MEAVGRGTFPQDSAGWEGGSSSSTAGAWEADGWLIMLL